MPDTQLVENLRRHVYILASDTLEGREATKKGQKKAAAYIAGQFQHFGLKPGASDSLPFYQQFSTQRLYFGQTGLIVQDIIFNNGNHFVFSSTQPVSENITLPIKVIAYTALNKVDWSPQPECIMVFSDQIKSAIDTIRKASEYTKSRYFAIVLPGDDDKVKAEIRKFRSATQEQYPEAAFNFMNNNSIPVFSDYLRELNPEIKIVLFDHFIFRLLSGLNPKEAHQIAIKSRKKEQIPDFKIDSLRLAVAFKPELKIASTENIIGYIEGSTHKDEYIIIGAHYDHLGRYENKIYYGADDNASGTAAVIELARLFANDALNGKLPGRTLVFMAFTAEEKGLCGSAWYVAHPLFKLENTRRMINFDMIGRSDKKPEKSDFVYLKSMGKENSVVKKISRQIDRKYNDFRIDRSPGFPLGLLYRFGSDHYPFVKKDIPSSVFFTGLHDDYHKPADSADKIRYENMAKIVQSAYELIDQLANLPAVKK